MLLFSGAQASILSSVLARPISVVVFPTLPLGSWSPRVEVLRGH